MHSYAFDYTCTDKAKTYVFILQNSADCCITSAFIKERHGVWQLQHIIEIDSD